MRFVAPQKNRERLDFAPGVTLKHDGTDGTDSVEEHKTLPIAGPWGPSYRLHFLRVYPDYISESRCLMMYTVFCCRSKQHVSSVVYRGDVIVFTVLRGEALTSTSG